jgi:hypothetical protein
LHEKLGVARLIPKIEIPRVAIICIKLPTARLVLALPLHLAGLLVDGKTRRQNPRLLPDVSQPTKELIHLEVWALVFWGRSHQWILAHKEVSKGMMLLLIPHTEGGGNPVVSVSRLL